jgi:hypothetical protein
LDLTTKNNLEGGFFKRHDEVTKEDTKDVKLEISKDKLGESENDNKENTEKLSPKEQLKKKDEDFYTRSMDLSDKDFVFDDFGEKGLPLVVKILLVIIILAIIALAGYFIFQMLT